MDTLPPDDRLTAIKEALYSGHKIEAIKLYREATGSQLVDAKNAVEKLEADLRSTSPEKFIAQSSRGGCSAMFALYVIVIGFVFWSIAR